MAFSSRSGCDLFFRFLLSAVSNPRPDWAGGNPASSKLSPHGCPITGALGALLVCPARALVLERFGDARRALLDRYGGVHSPFPEPVAAWNAGDLFCTVSVVRECGARFLELS